MGEGGGCIIPSAERRQVHCRWVWGYPPPEDFQIWRLLNAIFSTCHEICLRKIDLQYENGKQLQVTIIKITESKENKSIHRLDLSGSIGPGRAAALFPPHPSYGSDYSLNFTEFHPIASSRFHLSATTFDFQKSPSSDFIWQLRRSR